MSTANHPMSYYREKERIAYSAIPGIDKILSASPSERDKMEAAYPDAVFALMVADNLLGRDREQCEINQNAYFSILKGEKLPMSASAMTTLCANMWNGICGTIKYRAKRRKSNETIDLDW